MLATKQLTVAFDFHCIFPILWRSMATVNFLVPSVLQNIFCGAQMNKETHKGLERQEGE